MENKTRHKKITEITLSDLQKLEKEVAGNERSAVQFLVNPRTFLFEKGYLLPTNAKITILPTEEKKARFSTKEGLEEFFTDALNQQKGKIKIHVMDGLAKCVTVYIDCPCQKSLPNPNANGQDILTEMSLQEFYSIVTEAEKNDKLVDALIENPRLYFERKGFFASPAVIITAIHTSKYVEDLHNEQAVSKYLENDNRPIGKVYHISEGKGKCTHIEVTCDCDKK